MFRTFQGRYVCMYARMYVCIHIHIMCYERNRLGEHVCMYVSIYIYACIHTYHASRND